MLKLVLFVLLDFCNKNRECTQFSFEIVLKRYYDKKDVVLQKRQVIYARFKEFDNRRRALEEKLSVNVNRT